MNANRRQYSRLKVDREKCVVALRGELHDVDLLEESIGGVRIGGVTLLNLVQDEPVMVSIRDEEFLGWCRNVSKEPSGTFSVGIERAENTSQSSDRMLVNTYICNEGYHFVCFATTEKPVEPMRVCLWNRHELSVNCDQLTSLTEYDRRKQLADEDYLNVVKTVYGRSNTTLIQDILDFEF